MSTIAPSRRSVKPAVLFDGKPRRPSRLFALGLSRDNTAPRIAPYTDADRQWAAANLNATADATDAEWADEFEKRSMSAAEYRAFRAEVSAAMADRYTRADEAEMTENGVVLTHAELDRMAEESAWEDAYGRGVVVC